MRICVALALCSLTLLWNSSIAGAQESLRTIEVIGTGASTAEPVELVITASISANGETAKESYESFLQAKEAVRSTFDGMVFPSLELEFQGEKMVDAMANMNADFAFGIVDDGGAVPVEGGQSYGTSEDVKLRITGIDKMDKVVLRDMVLEILDRANESGVSVSRKANPMAAIYGYTATPSGLVEYELNTVDEVRGEAFAAAMKDAKKRADSLAKLSNGRIGRVLSVAQQSETGGAAEAPNPLAFAMQMAGDQPAKVVTRLRSDSPGPIAMDVQLKVVFELLDE